MKKLIFSLSFISSVLFAGEFELLLNEALKNSTKLQKAKSSIQKIKLQTSKLTRLKNPNLEGVISRFDDDDGYSVGFSQEIPFLSTNDDLEKLSELLIQKSKINYEILYSSFVKELSLEYLSYKKAKKLYDHSSQEIKLSKKIYNISKERFDLGNIAKTKLLQAKLSYQEAKQRQKSLKLDFLNSYYDLLISSNITTKLTLKANDSFSQLQKQSPIPLITLLKLKKKISFAKEKTNTKTLKSFSFFGEFEKEADDDIYRVGISMPFSFFNQKNEEKEIAKLDINSSTVSLVNFEETLKLQNQKLDNQRVMTQRMIKENKNILKEQQQLLGLLESGYKEAKTNLVQLLDLKERLIQNQKESISLEINLEKINISQNHINGAYHE